MDNSIPKSELVELGRLEVDLDYRRAPSDRRIASLSRRFKLDACGVLVVSRRADGRDFIVDGALRRVVLQEQGVERWHAQIVEGLTTEEEAKLFVKLNAERSNLSAAERYKARFHAGDPVVVTGGRRRHRDPK